MEKQLKALVVISDTSKSDKSILLYILVLFLSI